MHAFDSSHSPPNLSSSFQSQRNKHVQTTSHFLSAHFLRGIASSTLKIRSLLPILLQSYKNGTIEKLDGSGRDVPASLDSDTGVQSKDIVISPETNVSARLYATKDAPARRAESRSSFTFTAEGFPPAPLLIMLFTGTNRVSAGCERRDEEQHHQAWPYVCPSSTGPSDPRVNPVADPDLGKLGCKRVLVCLAERDPLVDAGKEYAEALRGRGGKDVEIFVR
ncbi:hypothetical protein C3L33_20903, partial [Rhododendron williamsianum]